MAKQSTAVAKKSDATQAPSFVQEDVGKGRLELGRSDIEVPRLKLAQATSKELDTYDDLRPGMFFHTATEDVLKAPVRMVPIYFERRYLLWNPLDSGGGILARADDGIHWSPPNSKFTVKLDKKNGGKTVTWVTKPTVDQSGLANWGTMDPDDPNSQPAATLMYNYLMGFPDHPEVMPAVFTFQRASAKVGKKFNTRLMIQSQRYPIYSLVYEVTTTKAANKAGQEFWMPELKGVGFLQERELYDQWKQMHDAYKSTGMKIADEDALAVDGEELAEGAGSADAPEGVEKTSKHTGRAKPSY